MDSNYMSTRFNLSGNRKELGQQIYVAKANFINFYLWLGKTPWLRLSKLGVLRVLRLRVLVLGLGVQWGGVGVAMSCVS